MADDYSNFYDKAICYSAAEQLDPHQLSTTATAASLKAGGNPHYINKALIAASFGEHEKAVENHLQAADLHDRLIAMIAPDPKSKYAATKLKNHQKAAAAHRLAAEAHATVALNSKEAPTVDYRPEETIPEDYYS